MSRPRPAARTALVTAGALLLGLLPARAGDVFDFIPAGGRTLLTSTLQTRPPADDVRALLTGKHTREEWLSHLRARGKAIPALQRLTEKELLTLADYLSFNMPLPAEKVPSNPAQASWEKVLPLDGRDLALEYCQSCHIITVVVTQDRTKEAWLGSLNKPSHVEIKLTRQQREALASYLVLNAAIPIDLVPEDLRAGGATY
jgi:mono/diheme cytochrome c family protein